MDIARLWEILERERRTASLQELPENFCDDVRSYIRRLDEEIKSADDSRKREILMDERKNARMKIENIVRRRMGKIVKFASSGSKIVPKGILDEEIAAYNVIRKQVDESISKILASLLGMDGEYEKTHEDEKTHEKVHDEKENRSRNGREREDVSSAADCAVNAVADNCDEFCVDECHEQEEDAHDVCAVMADWIVHASTADVEGMDGGKCARAAESAHVSGIDERDERDGRMTENARRCNGDFTEGCGNCDDDGKIDEEGKNNDEGVLSLRELKEDWKMDIVRVLKEMPAFVGIDGRTYKLYREDIVMLPEANADILCRKGYAVKIQYGRAKASKSEDKTSNRKLTTVSDVHMVDA